MFKGRGIDLVNVKGDYTERFNKTRELVDGLFSGVKNVQ